MPALICFSPAPAPYATLLFRRHAAFSLLIFYMPLTYCLRRCFARCRAAATFEFIVVDNEECSMALRRLRRRRERRYVTLLLFDLRHAVS